MALSEFPRLGFDPFVELRRMQSEMNRLFSGHTPAARDFPPVNVWLGDNSVVVPGELPGVTPDDVTINLQEDVLTLQGARRPKQEQGANWQLASVLTAPSPALCSCRFGSIPRKSRRASTTASWKSRWSG
jgi:HSP20 family molecular chaperone IbpA